MFQIKPNQTYSQLLEANSLMFNLGCWQKGEKRYHPPEKLQSPQQNTVQSFFYIYVFHISKLDQPQIKKILKKQFQKVLKGKT